MSDLSGGAKCIKYTLFVINMLFLLAALALIIVGAVVQVQATKNGFGGSVSGAGIFIIVIGSIVFVISFFGCAGAINNNYCMVVTYGVLLVILLLVEVAGIITGFVLKNKIQSTLNTGMLEYLQGYDPNNNKTIATETWDDMQKALQCCGTTGYQTWGSNVPMNQSNSVPDSCCMNITAGCGQGALVPGKQINLWTAGCSTTLATLFQKYLVAVGAVAAAIAILEVIGIIFAFCLAHSLRKDYRVV